jgi:hypothetical protein
MSGQGKVEQENSQQLTTIDGFTPNVDRMWIEVNQFGFSWVLFTLIYSPACWPLQEKNKNLQLTTKIPSGNPISCAPCLCAL